jgi:hypothetical protein
VKELKKTSEYTVPCIETNRAVPRWQPARCGARPPPPPPTAGVEGRCFFYVFLYKKKYNYHFPSIQPMGGFPFAQQQGTPPPPPPTNLLGSEIKWNLSLFRL